MKVKDAEGVDVLSFGLYRLDDRYVCNLCGVKFSTIVDTLNHIDERHMNDELPDVNPSEVN